jgi:hypothetical protein
MNLIVFFLNFYFMNRKKSRLFNIKEENTRNWEFYNAEKLDMINLNQFSSFK